MIFFEFTQLSCTSNCGSATVNKLITNTKTRFFLEGGGEVGLIYWPVEGLVTVQFAPSPWEVWMGQAAAVCHTNLCSHPTWKCPAGEVSWNKQHNNSIIYLLDHIFPNEKKIVDKKYKIINKSDLKIFPSENLMITEAKFLIILNILDRFWKTKIKEP